MRLFTYELKLIAYGTINKQNILVDGAVCSITKKDMHNGASSTQFVL